MSGTRADEVVRHLLNTNNVDPVVVDRLRKVFNQMLEAVPPPEDREDLLLVPGEGSAIWIARGHLFAVNARRSSRPARLQTASSRRGRRASTTEIGRSRFTSRSERSGIRDGVSAPLGRSATVGRPS
jgi:hypothetical protein